ncbi:hypothetical protein NQ176_g10712 [Zarea fungicola]|uniref:Uncharacterized protein n=1 Tax=Zarea fungicola TaxID=93591 RepID=A0ACC1MDX7_9HYPO|nr:hypothetical protein NQ176_g10712 [Lecanicillium fungicola]
MPSCLSSLWPAGWLPGQNPNTNINLQSIDLESSSDYLLRERLWESFQGVVNFAVIAVIYLVSELLIWGLSLALAPVQLEFLSSVFGMLIAFAIMILVCILIPNCNVWYERYIKSKVRAIASAHFLAADILQIDFINRHMGVAFAIPMVMLNGGTPMDARTIGLIIGAFVVTTLVAWTTIFMLARLALFLVNTLSKQISKRLHTVSSQKETEKLDNNPSQQNNALTSNATIFNNFALQRQPLLWTWLCQFWPLIASFLSIFAIGVPLSLVLDDPRALDGSVLWFIWVAAS